MVKPLRAQLRNFQARRANIVPSRRNTKSIVIHTLTEAVWYKSFDGFLLENNQTPRKDIVPKLAKIYRLDYWKKFRKSGEVECRF
jgi:hypothetical protein